MGDQGGEEDRAFRHQFEKGLHVPLLCPADIGKGIIPTLLFIPAWIVVN